MTMAPPRASVVPQDLSTRLRSLGDRFGIRNIRVFGSFARGESRPDSDIDLVVERTPGQSGFAFVRFCREAEARLGRRVDVATERSERLHLADIRDAIGRILANTSEGRVVRNIEIIGEATRGLSDATRRAHPAIPWRDMVDMRNKVIHDSFRTDLEVVWDVVTNDLRPLREQIDPLLEGSE